MCLSLRARSRGGTWGVLATAALTLLLASCSERFPTAPVADQLSERVIVSAPLALPGAVSPSAAGVARTIAVSGAAVGDRVAFVSLPPGSVPGGKTATISNLATSQSLTVSMADGGFDPVAIPARIDDALRILVRDQAAGVLASVSIKVPGRRPPTIVRTSPPNGKTDVPLNTRLVVVFSEPMDSTTVTQQSVQLSLRGTSVAGSTHSEATVAEFEPAAQLVPSAQYRLDVAATVRSAAGEMLASAVAIDFTTGTAVSSLDGVVIAEVSTGSVHTCALTSAGNAYCWGSNEDGQLGDGSLDGSVGRLQALPTLVAGGHTFLNITADAATTCAVMAADGDRSRTDGTAYCWGREAWGLLGRTPASPPSYVLTPTAVEGGLAFVSISGGWSAWCGLTSSRSVYCWGNRPPGTGATDITSPALVGGGHAFTTLSQSVDDNTTFGMRYCGLAEGAMGYCWGGHDEQWPVTVDSLPTLVMQGRPLLALAGNGDHSCAITTDGAAYCWGLNDKGQLGAISTDSCAIWDDFARGTINLPCATAPIRVAGGLAFASIAVTVGYTCALTPNGAAYCWGTPATDGYPPWLSSAAPVAVPGGLTFKSISTGDGHACGITTTGTLYCWGDNQQGQVGDGTGVYRSAPVRIGGPR